MLINFYGWYFEPAGCSLIENPILEEYKPTGKFRTKILLANGDFRNVYKSAEEVAKEINKLILEASISGKEEV